MTIEQGHDLYRFNADAVGDVLSVSSSLFDEIPSTIDATSREHALGVYRLEGELLVLLDVESLLQIGGEQSLKI